MNVILSFYFHIIKIQVSKRYGQGLLFLDKPLKPSHAGQSKI